MGLVHVESVVQVAEPFETRYDRLRPMLRLSVKVLKSIFLISLEFTGNGPGKYGQTDFVGLKSQAAH